MTDEPTEAPWPPQAFVSAADFRAVDYNAIIRGLRSVYDHKLETEFMKMARVSRDKEPEFRVFRLLASLCGLHFRPQDKAGAFGASMVSGNSRTTIPEDWLGEQNTVFAEIVSEIEHPALRARLADVAWTNDRKKAAMAQIAVLAYCECVEGLIQGTFEKRFPSDKGVSLEAVDLIDRAAQIHSRSSKRNAPMHDSVAALLDELYGRAQKRVDVVALNRLATLLSRYSLISMDDLAKQMEVAASSAEKTPDSYPLPIKDLWDLAAFAYGEVKRLDDQRRCQIAGVEQTLRMAHRVGSASAQAHWYRQAIHQLRNIHGTEERREQLRQEMRRLQEKALEEAGSFSIPIDLSEIVTGTIQIFETLTLPEALRQFALLIRPTSANQLRSEVLEEPSGIAGLFATKYLDPDGKIIAEVEGAPLDGEPSEDWIKSKMAQRLGFSINIAVSGQLEPARCFLGDVFPLAERHFRFIVVQSPFVPRSHAATFALGFARMMQGDMLSAGALLIPQLEHCLRYVLANSSIESSKMRSDLIQEDRSLSTLLEIYNKDLIRIFGEDLTLHIDLLFNHRPGPALRHEFAHGKIGDGSHANPAIYYACCFIYLLVCIPLLPRWAEDVAPAIENGSF